MAAMTSSISKFQNSRKMDLANIRQIICRKCHPNPSICLGCSAVTHTHTHTHTHTYIHTHTHTHTLGSIATYSVKLAEYKKDNIMADVRRLSLMQKHFLLLLKIFCTDITHTFVQLLLNCTVS